MKTLLLTILVSTVFLASVFAESIENRQANQAKRIGKGIVNDSLTNGEMKSVQHGQQKIQNMIKDAKSDHNFSKRERKEVQQELNHQSKKIYNLKHNDNAEYRQNHRKKNQNSLNKQLAGRVGRLLANGKITPAQANDFGKRIKAAKELQKAYMADGKLSKEEAAYLRQVKNGILKDMKTYSNNAEEVADLEEETSDDSSTVSGDTASETTSAQ